MTNVSTPIHLGCIADDFTGATDLANNLMRAGMRVVQTIGVPTGPLQAAGAVDAVVIALKSRTNPTAEAVEQSLCALRWLQENGARQIYFKYCSTFDSTPQGNIGPVTEALMDALDCPFTIATPAFPAGERTVFKGHLFVGDVLLHESGMRDHPLTPMHDANLVRVLQAQCQRKVGLIEHSVVSRGAEAVTERMAQLHSDGVGIAIVDAISDDDLQRIAPAFAGLPLVTAASGLATALPATLGFAPSPAVGQLPPKTGRRAILVGSCSQATQRQIKDFIARGGLALQLCPSRIIQEFKSVDATSEALDWALEAFEKDHDPVLIYSTADSETIREAMEQAQLFSVKASNQYVEESFAMLACGLVAHGVRQLIVAGGETSGACVQALRVEQMQIGPQIATGVPWCYASTAFDSEPHAIHLALKSGNFGGDDFFTHAFEVLP